MPHVAFASAESVVGYHTENIPHPYFTLVSVSDSARLHIVRWCCTTANCRTQLVPGVGKSFKFTDVIPASASPRWLDCDRLWHWVRTFPQPYSFILCNKFGQSFNKWGPIEMQLSLITKCCSRSHPGLFPGINSLVVTKVVLWSAEKTRHYFPQPQVASSHCSTCIIFGPFGFSIIFYTNSPVFRGSKVIGQVSRSALYYCLLIPKKEGTKLRIWPLWMIWTSF